MEEVLVEKEKIEREEKVPKMVVELKHMYSKENTIRGRVLLSEAFKILENYSQMPQTDVPIEKWEQSMKTQMSPQGKVAFVRNIAQKQRVIQEPGSGCIWCGSKRVKEFVQYPREGFNGYECLDCKNKFYR